MQKIRVVLHEIIRDGGTEVYIDELNRLYFKWHSMPKVYNQWLFPHGTTKDLVPPSFVLEIPVELEIVDDFK